MLPEQYRLGMRVNMNPNFLLFAGVKAWAALKRDHCLKLGGPEALRLGCIFGLASDAGERIILDRHEHLRDVALRDATEVVKDVCLELKVPPPPFLLS